MRIQPTTETIIRCTLNGDALRVRSMTVFVAGLTLVVTRILWSSPAHNQTLVVLHDLDATDRVGQFLVVQVPGDVWRWVTVDLTLDVDLSSDSDLVSTSQVQTGSDRY